jgi:hypothetical protein
MTKTPSREEIQQAMREAKAMVDAQSIDDLFSEPIDSTDRWPLHKTCVQVYNDKDEGPVFLEELLVHAGSRYELLADNARELERRHFGHVAEILWKVAENARSEVDDIIEREQARPSRLHSPEWYVGQWARSRMQVTGQSRNELIAFYKLEEWLPNAKVDYVYDKEGRRRDIPTSNGAEADR